MNDATTGFVWLLANILLISTAWHFHRRLLPKDGMGLGIIHTVVACWACVVGVSIVLGLLRVLSPGLLMAGVCLLCALPRVLSGHLAKNGPRRESHQLFAHFDRTSRLWAATWGLLGSLLLARVILDGLLEFPTDWDTLAYHLPLIDHWIREGTLFVPDCAFWYCPGNNELLGLWFVAPFSGDFLIALNNLPAVVLLAAATVELATLLNVWRPLCHLAGMVVMTTEPTWHQAISAENDVAVAALFLAALVYGLRFGLDTRKADMWLAGIAVGLLTGTKYTAVGYAVTAGVSLLTVLALRRRPRDVFAALAVCVAGVLLFGAYWYLRNAYFTGAPLFPKGFTESTDLWAKIRPHSHTSSLLRSGRAEVWPLYADAVRKVASVGHLVAVVMLPVVLVWISGSGLVVRRGGLRARKTRLWFSLVMMLGMFVCLVTPNIVETVAGTMNMLRQQYHSVRLSLPFLSLCVVALMVPLSDVFRTLHRNRNCLGASEHWGWRRLSSVLGALRRAIPVLVVGVAVAALVHQASIHVWKDIRVDLLLTACNLFLLGVLLTWSIPFLVDHRRAAVLFGLTLLVGVGWGCKLSSARWHAGFCSEYNQRFGSVVFTALAGIDTASERLCICDNRYYPFFGSRRQVNVCRPLWLPDYETFQGHVWEKQATIVVTCNVDFNEHQRYDHVAGWIDSHSEAFGKIDGDYVYTWVRVIRTEEKQPGSLSVAVE